MKLLIILNENPPGSHENVYYAFANLKKKGLLEDYRVYPFLSRLSQGVSSKEVLKEVYDISSKYQPSFILWSHNIGLSIDDRDINRLKGLPSKPIMGYWDGDIYGRFYKPISKEIIDIAKHCNVVFCQGNGWMVKKMKKAGIKDIRYVPATTDSKRFGHIFPANREVVYDVVMVGNYFNKIIPWKMMPGNKFRKKIADYFYKKLNNKFVVYGSGWNAPYAKGPVTFRDQHKVYNQSKLILGVNSINEEYYFSNRLPIALSSGVPVIHNYEKGYNIIFKEINENVFFFRTIEESWEITERLLGKSKIELESIGSVAREYALQKMTTENIFEYMLKVFDFLRSGNENKDQIVKNSWIDLEKL